MSRDDSKPDSRLIDVSAIPRIAVIGAGYVGLTTAVCLAYLGYLVNCGEIDDLKVASLQRGIATVTEERLDELLKMGLESGHLRFIRGAADAVIGAEFVFLCVPTPGRDDGSADTTILERVTREIAPHLSRHCILINKSTVPIGSAAILSRLLGRSDVTVVANPEFLREGSAIHDFLHPDRIVIGADNSESAARVSSLFEAMDVPLLITDPQSAETIKYVSNAFLATKLSYVNSVANLCESLGADINDVLMGMAYDHRIGSDYMQPGPGWGGSCLPKDTMALLKISEENGYSFPILREVISTNQSQQNSIVDKVQAAVGGSLVGISIAVWGLTFKAGTDDRRDSPAIQISRQLLDRGAKVQAYDPTTTRIGFLPELAEVDVRGDAYAACEGAMALAILTEWDEFRRIDFTKVGERLRNLQIVDSRNILDPVSIRKLGFGYTCLGAT